MLQEAPLVTVITTVHDLRPYVGRCIDSVLAQTYQQWEQIIVDDGSTDGTEALVRQYTDPRIRYHRLPKRGVPGLSQGYNTALSLSKGELVAVLEGDDYWPAEKLERQVAAFHDPEVQLTWGRAIVVDEQGRALWHWPPPRLRKQELAIEELFRLLCCANILTPTVTVMVRRTALDAVSGFRQPAGALFVDLPTWLIVAATSRGKALMLDDLLGYYRVHPAQISTEFRFEYFTAQADVVEAIFREIPDSEFHRLGWTLDEKRKADGCAALARGDAYLRIGRMAEARRNYVTGATQVGEPGKMIRALLGFLSTYARRDLLNDANNLRRRLQRMAASP